MTSNLLPTRGLDARDVTSVAMCSGVPSLTSAFVEVSETYFGLSPLVVGAGVKTGIRILYDNPRDVGADRIVDAAAALKLYGGAGHRCGLRDRDRVRRDDEGRRVFGWCYSSRHTRRGGRTLSGGVTASSRRVGAALYGNRA